MSTTNEPDLTQILDAIKLLVTSEALVAHPAQHFTTRLAQVHALLPNLEDIAQEPVDDACHSLPPAVLRVDAQRWTDQLCVTGANLIRHVTRIVRARQGVNPSVPVLSLTARNLLRRASELLARTGLAPHLSKFGKGSKDQSSAVQSSLAAMLHVIRALVESIAAEELWSEIHGAVLSEVVAGVAHVMGIEHVTDCTDQDLTRVTQWAASQLDYLIEHVPVSELAEHLFVLLKMASAQTPPVPQVTRQIGTILSRLLLRPGGLFGVLTPILTAKNVSPASYLQAARIVTAVPRQLTAAEYFARICPQVRQLLTVRGIDACHFASCAVSVVTLMLQQHREHVMKYLLREIMRPFTEFMRQFEQDTSHVTPTRGLISLNSVSTTSLTRVIVSEAELAQSVTELHELLTRHVTPVMCEVVTPILPALFALYAALRRVSKGDHHGDQPLTRVKEMLITWVNAVESSELTRVLQTIVIDLPRKTDCLKWQYRFESRVVDQGAQISLVRVESACVAEYAVEAECVIDMLTGVTNASTFIGDYFVQILHLLIDQLKVARDSGELNSFLLTLLGLMCEQFKDSIFSNVVQILTFLRVLIDQCVDSLAEHVTDAHNTQHVIDEDMLHIALNILDTMLHSGRAIDRAEELLLFDLVAPLRLIGQFPRESLASSATALHDKIVNRDISWAQTSTSSVSVNDDSVNALESALRDLNDPLLPVRAHGLIALRRLVLARDPHTMQHLTRVVEIFRTQLQDDDSYVYLGAIRGFSALGDVEFETIVPLMRDLFLEYQIGEKKPKIEVIGANAKNKSFTEFELTKRLEVRLKIGEAFLQIAQRLGEALPKYAATLVPIFLAGCRDPDPLVRASALSNLAELCELLHYALLPFLEEIVSCVQSLLQSDTTVEVRRGVINLYAQLLTGLEDEVFEVMPHHLHAIYSTLKHVQANDEDEVCRVHAEYAVNSLKHAVGQFVTPVEPDSALYRMLKIVK